MKVCTPFTGYLATYIRYIPLSYCSTYFLASLWARQKEFRIENPKNIKIKLDIDECTAHRYSTAPEILRAQERTAKADQNI